MKNRRSRRKVGAPTPPALTSVAMRSRQCSTVVHDSESAASRSACAADHATVRSSEESSSQRYGSGTGTPA